MAKHDGFTEWPTQSFSPSTLWLSIASQYLQLSKASLDNRIWTRTPTLSIFEITWRHKDDSFFLLHMRCTDLSSSGACVERFVFLPSIFPLHTLNLFTTPWRFITLFPYITVATYPFTREEIISTIFRHCYYISLTHKLTSWALYDSRRAAVKPIRFVGTTIYWLLPSC